MRQLLHRMDFRLINQPEPSFVNNKVHNFLGIKHSTFFIGPPGQTLRREKKIQLMTRPRVHTNN